MTEFINPFSEREHFYEHAEWLAEHLLNFFREDETLVIHEIPTLDIHMDVYFIRPKNADFNILLTSGMSALKMNFDAPSVNSSEYEFAELMMLIPKDVEFEKFHVFTGEKKDEWIISFLKYCAKFPHFYDTWIGIGHTIQANEDMTPFNEFTDFVAALILPSVTFDRDFTEIKKNGRQINLYNVMPLYKDELEFKIQNGFDPFIDLLIRSNGNEVLDLKRKSVIPEKPF